MISTGWPLRRIHDVKIPVQEAIAHDADFAPFLASCQRITEYYIETRYPVGIHTLLQPETVQADLKTARTLSELIRDKVFPRQSRFPNLLRSTIWTAAPEIASPARRPS